MDAEFERLTPKSSPFPTINSSPFQSILKTRGFKIGTLNIASLHKHIDELIVVMEKQPFDILAVNETRLDETIPDSSIQIPGYFVVRNDRNRNGGGVCAYVRSSINIRRRTDLESSSLELLALEVKKPNSKPFLVYCWYRPPHSPVECFDIFEQLINKAEFDYTDIYITGDINCDLLSDTRELHTTRLINLLETYQLSQFIKEPTKGNRK